MKNSNKFQTNNHINSPKALNDVLMMSSHHDFHKTNINSHCCERERYAGGSEGRNPSFMLMALSHRKNDNGKFSIQHSFAFMHWTRGEDEGKNLVAAMFLLSLALAYHSLTYQEPSFVVRGGRRTPMLGV